MLKKITLLGLILLPITGCKDLDTINENNPTRDGVLASGADLKAVLQAGYVAWWRGVHGEHPAIALGVASDAYTMSWGDFGAFRMGLEPRTFYNNRPSEEPDYRKIVEAPWQGCLSAVSAANDVLRALDNGVGIDAGGPQDEGIRAAAHFLRGVSWGYLGLLFDQALLVSETTDIEKPLPFAPYREMIDSAAVELEEAISLTTTNRDEFLHEYFHGLRLLADDFLPLCHSYIARFLAQWPRTAAENAQVDWAAVLANAKQGLTKNFAPLADGNFWTSYQRYVFAETGEGPLWARVDQRLIAAMDPNQPARYPEVSRLGEPPLAKPRATSADRRLEMDFAYFPQNNFPIDRGEWFFSHYKHNRNKTDPGFAGNGSTDGPMPVFLAADNDLLRAEALLRLGRLPEAVDVLNAGTRVKRGQLPPLKAAAMAADIEQAIFYERAIELLSTAPMGFWFDRRRHGAREAYNAMTPLGGLQTGTPAQLPVPAGELRIQGADLYNFGGEQDPEGIVPIF